MSAARWDEQDPPANRERRIGDNWRLRYRGLKLHNKTPVNLFRYLPFPPTFPDYIPKDKILGLSKINRLVRFFARRPQVQERLTRQILVALQALLRTDDVAVSIEATHYCVKSRGVMDSNSQTSTTALGGCFLENIHTAQNS